MTKFFAVLVLAVLVLAVAQGQTSPTVTKTERRNLSEAQRLSPEETQSLWSRVPVTNTGGGGMSAKATIFLEQADAVIEVSGTQDRPLVEFRTLTPIPGTTISFRMLVPGNMVSTTLGSFRIPLGSGWGDYSVGFQMWDGATGSWPPGYVLFEAVLEDISGNISYVSVHVPFGGCCGVDGGPLRNVFVTADSNTINFVAVLQGRTFATLNGSTFSYGYGTYADGHSEGDIDISHYSNGFYTLTMCNSGECITRVVYITRPPGQGK